MSTENQNVFFLEGIHWIKTKRKRHTIVSVQHEGEGGWRSEDPARWGTVLWVTKAGVGNLWLVHPSAAAPCSLDSF